jgi:hypothetical protein
VNGLPLGSGAAGLSASPAKHAKNGGEHRLLPLALCSDMDQCCFPRLAEACRAFRSLQRYAYKQTSEGWSNIIDYRFRQ